MSACLALSEALEENQLQTCSSSIVIQDTQNSVHAHGERKITEEPALVWLHLISATRKDAMVSNRQALVREKRNHYEKFHNWEFPLWRSGNESD